MVIQNSYSINPPPNNPRVIWLEIDVVGVSPERVAELKEELRKLASQLPEGSKVKVDQR